MLKKTFFLLGIALLAWCPWLDAPQALSLVDARVAELQKENSNLCPITIQRETIRRIPFGYTEQILYDCSGGDELYATFDTKTTVYITFYKGVVGLPKKVLRDI